MKNRLIYTVLALIFISGFAYCQETDAAEKALPWWSWPLIMMGITFIMGVFAVLGGVGGGVIFVPIVSGFFPFHMDFVRGTGLLVAMTSALFAGPKLLERKLVNLRLVMPIALVVSLFAGIGAHVGMLLPPSLVQICLGVIVLGVTALMLRKKTGDHHEPVTPDALSSALGICGVYHDPALDKDITWHVHRFGPALLIFCMVGFVAGIFGLGAGWANVPVLSMVMGLPVKVAAATSGFVVSIGSSAAAWVYINKGAVIPLITIPSIVGMALGARLGAHLLPHVKPGLIRRLVIGTLFFAGLRALWKGLAPFVTGDAL